MWEFESGNVLFKLMLLLIFSSGKNLKNAFAKFMLYLDFKRVERDTNVRDIRGFTAGFRMTFCFSDVLNVSGRFNSEELARDMSVGEDIKDEPFFEESLRMAPQNVSALIGKTAFLTCVVRNLGKAKSVSFNDLMAHVVKDSFCIGL